MELKAGDFFMRSFCKSWLGKKTGEDESAKESKCWTDHSSVLNGIKVRVFFGKKTAKNTCAVMIKIIIAFANQI